MKPITLDDEPLPLQQRVYIKEADVFGTIKGRKQLPATAPIEYMIICESPMLGYEWKGTVQQGKLHFPLPDTVTLREAFEQNEQRGTLSLHFHVPRTYDDAILLWPFVREFPAHEWDNRTTLENAAWLLGQLRKRM